MLWLPPLSLKLRITAPDSSSSKSEVWVLFVTFNSRMNIQRKSSMGQPAACYYWLRLPTEELKIFNLCLSALAKENNFECKNDFKNRIGSRIPYIFIERKILYSASLHRILQSHLMPSCLPSVHAFRPACSCLWMRCLLPIKSKYLIDIFFRILS